MDSLSYYLSLLGLLGVAGALWITITALIVKGLCIGFLDRNPTATHWWTGFAFSALATGLLALLAAFTLR